jgi:DNA-directed RNA polymerase subunit F
LKETCEKGERAESAKALAYFGVAAIIVNVNDWTELSKVFELRRGQSYLEAFESCSPEVLLKLSQELIMKYFKTC